MSFFSRIINLENRKDRWSMMKNSYLNINSLNFERFDAVKITSNDIAEIHLSPRARADFLSGTRLQHQAISGLGAIGCALSHIKVWQDFLTLSKNEFALVLEDDLNPNHSKFIHKSLKIFLNNPSDIFLLGWCGNINRVDLNSKIKIFPSSKGFVGAQAYVLNRKAAQILLTHVYPIEMQIDYSIQAIADKFNLRVGATDNSLCIKQVFTGSNVFTLCFFCEPTYIYATIGALLSLLIYIACVKIKM